MLYSLPLAVSGKAVTKRMYFGTFCRLMLARQYARSSSSSALSSGLSRTSAHSSSPIKASGMPITWASATFGWRIRKASIFGERHHQHQPFRHIGRPDGDVFAFFNAEREQPFGQPVDFIAVLPISQPQIESQLGRSVNDGLAIRPGRSLLVEQIADSQLDQFETFALSFPDGAITFDPHTCSSASWLDDDLAGCLICPLILLLRLSELSGCDGCYRRRWCR
jgi:hypothetical protein